MRFPRLLASTAVAALIMGASGSASAQNIPFDLTATATVTSDYLFRGISQTAGDPAFQASLEAGMENGFFFGVWGSNVDFGPTSDADYEVDLYVGYANEIGDFSYTAKALYYVYPGTGSEDLDYVEVGVDLAYTVAWATYGVSAYWTPDYSGNTGDAWYLAYSTDVALSEQFTFSVGVGWNGFEEGDHYLNSTVGVAYSYEDWVVDVTYSLTDRTATPNKWVLTVSKSF